MKMVTTFDDHAQFIERLKPVFLPGDPVKNDIICYFASLLRVLGMEDGGWDPYAESRGVLNDINSFFELELPKEHFKEPHKTSWRLACSSTATLSRWTHPMRCSLICFAFNLAEAIAPIRFSRC